MSDLVVVTPDQLAAIVRAAVRDGVKTALADASRGKGENLREPDAAAYLGIAAETLRKWRSQGRGPVYRKIGNAVTYARADLDAWADKGRTLTADYPGARRGMPC